MKNIKISTVCKYKDKYIAFAKNINLLFEFDLEGNTQGLCVIPESDNDRLVENIVEWNDKIILIPLCANNIYIYDYISGNLDCINIFEDKKHIRFKFFNAFLRDKYLYLVGSFYPAILWLNLEDKTLYEINIYKDNCEKQISLSDCYARKSILQMNEKLHIPSSISNEVYVFDMGNEIYEKKRVGDSVERYSGIEFDGECYWLSPRFGTDLLKVYPNGEIKKIDLSEFCSPGYNFAGILIIDGKVLLLALHLEHSLAIDLKDEKIQKFITGDDVLFEKTGDEIITQYNDGKINIFGKNNSVIELDYEGIYSLLDSKELRKYFYQEGNPFTLDDFLDEIRRGTI